MKYPFFYRKQNDLNPNQILHINKRKSWYMKTLSTQVYFKTEIIHKILEDLILKTFIVVSKNLQRLYILKCISVTEQAKCKGSFQTTFLTTGKL